LPSNRAPAGPEAAGGTARERSGSFSPTGYFVPFLFDWQWPRQRRPYRRCGGGGRAAGVVGDADQLREAADLPPNHANSGPFWVLESQLYGAAILWGNFKRAQSVLTRTIAFVRPDEGDERHTAPGTRRSRSCS
jgi:hypothetical protein